ncbi:MAG: thioredoxin family protein [Verrucomicrobiota bacterium]|jgi:thioredoxin 1
MKQITRAEFESEVLGSKEPVLVDFYTDSCPPCRMMAPVLQEMETEANGQFKVVKIDAGVEGQLASTFRVNSVPAFFVFNNGKCVGQTLGAKSKVHMKKWLEDSIRSL